MVIRNISNYPIGLVDRKRKERSYTGLMNRTYNKERTNMGEQVVEQVKFKHLNGTDFVITVRLDGLRMLITAIPQKVSNPEAKVIEIPRDEANVFLAEECGDRV